MDDQPSEIQFEIQLFEHTPDRPIRTEIEPKKPVTTRLKIKS